MEPARSVVERPESHIAAAIEEPLLQIESTSDWEWLPSEAPNLTGIRSVTHGGINAQQGGKKGSHKPDSV